MTIEQVRDRIAELLGFHGCGNHWNSPKSGCVFDHPCPHTIDGIAALMPRETWVCKIIEHKIDTDPKDFTVEAFAERINRHPAAIRCAEAPTELEARTHLLLAVLESEKTHAK